MSHRKSRKNILSGGIGVMFITAVAVWQFYQFVTFQNADGIGDLQGGKHHLWWAIGLGLFAFIVAFLLFSVFLRYDRNDEMHITSLS
jgi:hypothetical protein